jgi:hypothetical protein
LLFLAFVVYSRIEECGRGEETLVNCQVGEESGFGVFFLSLSSFLLFGSLLFFPGEDFQEELERGSLMWSRTNLTLWRVRIQQSIKKSEETIHSSLLSLSQRLAEDKRLFC